MKRHYDFSKAAKVTGGFPKTKGEADAILREQKMLTSIRLDREIVEIAKKRAKEEGVGYLTWINKKLRSAVLQEENLEDRVQKLEKAVFKKKTA